MTKDEALKMASDALETYSQLGTTAKIRKAVAAVKKALAQQEQELQKWVGLTAEEVNSWELPDSPTVFDFVQFIEAKLKEKNT